MLKSAKEGIRSAYASEEYALIQAINAYLEMSKAYNLAFERLSEWYGLYFPELKISNPKTLADLAIVLNDAQAMSKEGIASVLKDEKHAEEVYSKASSTIGRRMNDGERAAVVRFAQLANELANTLDTLDSYIKKVSTEIMPNTTYLTDERIAAELLSKAGSLERLAVLPASTIQLLGAEKSLFKHLKFGSKPPKYGLIFKLPEISGAPKDQRGRIARLYAAKISIALKSDYFTKNFIAERLKADLKRNVERIQEAGPRRRERRPWPRESKHWDRGPSPHPVEPRQWVQESKPQVGGPRPWEPKPWGHESRPQPTESRPWEREQRPPTRGQRPEMRPKPWYHKSGQQAQGVKPWERKPKPWMRKQRPKARMRGKRKA
jgi:nucleolar protein 56